MNKKQTLVKMRIKCTGMSLGGFDGDGIHGTDQYQIIEIISQCPLLNQKVRDHIDEGDVRKFKEMGVEVVYS